MDSDDLSGGAKTRYDLSARQVQLLLSELGGDKGRYERPWVDWVLIIESVQCEDECGRRDEERYVC